MQKTIYLMMAILFAGCSGGETKDSSKSNSDANSQKNTKPDASEEPKKKMVDAIQGRWVITEANISGKPFDAMKGAIAEIKGNEITVEAGGQKTTSKMEFRDETSPVQLDVVNAAGQSAKAIIQLNDDELVVNTSLTGAEYPPSFEPGSGLMLVKYKRE